jgi:hypothetical protein
LKLGILKPSQRKQYKLKEELNCYVSFAQGPKYLCDMLDEKSWGRQKRKQRQQKGFRSLYCIFCGDFPFPSYKMPHMHCFSNAIGCDV